MHTRKKSGILKYADRKTKSKKSFQSGGSIGYSPGFDMRDDPYERAMLQERMERKADFEAFQYNKITPTKQDLIKPPKPRTYSGTVEASPIALKGGPAGVRNSYQAQLDGMHANLMEQVDGNVEILHSQAFRQGYGEYVKTSAEMNSNLSDLGSQLNSSSEHITSQSDNASAMAVGSDGKVMVLDKKMVDGKEVQYITRMAYDKIYDQYIYTMPEAIDYYKNTDSKGNPSSYTAQLKTGALGYDTTIQTLLGPVREDVQAKLKGFSLKEKKRREDLGLEVYESTNPLYGGQSEQEFQKNLSEFYRIKSLGKKVDVEKKPELGYIAAIIRESKDAFGTAGRLRASVLSAVYSSDAFLKHRDSILNQEGKTKEEKKKALDKMTADLAEQTTMDMLFDKKFILKPSQVSDGEVGENKAGIDLVTRSILVDEKQDEVIEVDHVVIGKNEDGSPAGKGKDKTIVVSYSPTSTHLASAAEFGVGSTSTEEKKEENKLTVNKKMAKIASPEPSRIVMADGSSMSKSLTDEQQIALMDNSIISSSKGLSVVFLATNKDNEAVFSHLDEIAEYKLELAESFLYYAKNEGPVENRKLYEGIRPADLLEKNIIASKRHAYNHFVTFVNSATYTREKYIGDIKKAKEAGNETKVKNIEQEMIERGIATSAIRTIKEKLLSSKSFSKMSMKPYIKVYITFDEDEISGGWQKGTEGSSVKLSSQLTEASERDIETLNKLKIKSKDIPFTNKGTYTMPIYIQANSTLLSDVDSKEYTSRAVTKKFVRNMLNAREHLMDGTTNAADWMTIISLLKP